MPLLLLFSLPFSVLLHPLIGVYIDLIAAANLHLQCSKIGHRHHREPKRVEWNWMMLPYCFTTPLYEGVMFTSLRIGHPFLPTQLWIPDSPTSPPLPRRKPNSASFLLRSLQSWLNISSSPTQTLRNDWDTVTLYIPLILTSQFFACI